MCVCLCVCVSAGDRDLISLDGCGAGRGYSWMKLRRSLSFARGGAAGRGEDVGKEPKCD